MKDGKVAKYVSNDHEIQSCQQCRCRLYSWSTFITTREATYCGACGLYQIDTRKLSSDNGHKDRVSISQ